MSDHHRARVEDQLRRLLSSLLGTLRDPRIGLASVTKVELSPDLRVGRAYVSFVDEAEAEVGLEALRGAAGHLRSEVGRRMRLKHVPDLTYVIDRTISAQARIESLLRGDDEAEGPES